jgi:hypothetical protein
MGLWGARKSRMRDAGLLRVKEQTSGSGFGAPIPVRPKKALHVRVGTYR